MSLKDAEAKFGKARKELLALKKRRDSIQSTINKAKLPNSGVSDARIKKLNESLSQVNSSIGTLERTLKNSNQILTNIRKIEETDKSLTSNYNAYKQALARGENVSSFERNIENLLKQRNGLITLGVSSFIGYSPVGRNWKAEIKKEESLKKPERYKGSGTKNSPLTLNDKAFTGTYQGKQYKNGIVVVEAKKELGGDAGTPGGGNKYTGSGTKNNPLTLNGKPFTGNYQGKKYKDGILQEEVIDEDTDKVEKPLTLSKILEKTEFWFDLPDYIFNLDKELGDLLVEAVNNKWNKDKFESALKLTKWVQRNAESVRKRIISRAKHDELRAMGEDVSNSEYARDTANLRRKVQSRAQTLGANLTEEQLDQIVGKIYSGVLDDDSNAITRFISPYIGKSTSIVGTGLGTGGGQDTYSGEALSNYQELQRIAKANGLKLEDILPKISVPVGSTLENVVLQRLATGDLDSQAIAQAARQFAAQGQPDYVRKLLGQGYDLDQVYAPYRNVMANILELNLDQIDLNDQTLRGAITNEGDMNIYDFKKLLRKDSRWDTTENARQEVSSAVYSILRDFGFQG